LPAAADNQSQLQIRVITTNASGNDEWVGIDDVSITGTPLEGDIAPAVSGTSPANGATNIALDANIDITFSEAVNTSGAWFTLSCTTSGSHTATAGGGPVSFTLDPDTDFANNESCSVTVLASQVTDQDANDPPDNMAADYTFSFTPFDVCVEPFTPIYDIQGSGLSAAITGNVTAVWLWVIAGASCQGSISRTRLEMAMRRPQTAYSSLPAAPTQSSQDRWCGSLAMRASDLTKPHLIAPTATHRQSRQRTSSIVAQAAQRQPM
jgi:hypothetical protein